MSNAERTRNMTDAEVLEDLKAQRKARRSPRPEPRDTTPVWVYLFAILGVLVVLSFITNLH